MPIGEGAVDEQSAVEWGQKEACETLGEWLGVEPALLHHILATYGKCGCVFDPELGDTHCEAWIEQEDAWFKEFHGITKAQWLEREAARRAREAVAHAARRQRSVAELAAEQGINPNLLP